MKQHLEMVVSILVLNGCDFGIIVAENISHDQHGSFKMSDCEQVAKQNNFSKHVIF